MFGRAGVLYSVIAAIVVASPIALIAQDSSSVRPGKAGASEPGSDAVLVAMQGGRLVWLGPEGERDVVVGLGEEPGAAVMTRDRQRAYVAVAGGVVAVDLAKNAVAGRVALSGEHWEAGDGSRLYAVHTVTANPYEPNFVVSVIDTAALKVAGQISLAELVVSDATITPDGAMLYISHEGLKVREYPIRVAIAPDGLHVYVLHNGDNVATLLLRSRGHATQTLTLSDVPVAIARRVFDNSASEIRRSAYESLVATAAQERFVLFAGAFFGLAMGVAVGW